MAPPSHSPRRKPLRSLPIPFPLCLSSVLTGGIPGSHDQGALCLPLGSVAVKGRDHVASTSQSCDQASGRQGQAWSKLVPPVCALPDCQAGGGGWSDREKGEGAPMRGRELEGDRGGAGGAESNETSHSGTDSRLCQSIQKRPAGTLTSKEIAFLHSGERWAPGTPNRSSANSRFPRCPLGLLLARLCGAQNTAGPIDGSWAMKPHPRRALHLRPGVNQTETGSEQVGAGAPAEKTNRRFCQLLVFCL